MSAVTRRDFLGRGLKIAGLTGLSGSWTGDLARYRPSREADGVGRRAPRAIDARRDPASEPFFGAQTHFGQFRPQPDEILDLVKAAGVGWIRDEVYWSEVEKERGVFKFPPAYDDYLRAARARGLQVLLILDFSNPIYTGSDKRAPATDAERQAFARYCREVVARCKPLGVRHYEIWNEPNASTFWRPQPNAEDYARLLEAAYRAGKEADPEATIVGCSTSGVDLDFIGRVMSAGGVRFLDGVSFHPYCQPNPPERRLLADISRVQKLVPDKPLWITEFGYPTYAGPSGVDDEMQANYLVRAFLLGRSAPAVKRFCWYDFQNDGDDPGEGEFNFGLVRMNQAPKPAYLACKTMASLARDLPSAELEIDGGTYVVRSGAGEAPFVAIWRLGGSESVEIPYPKGPCRIVERDGESRAAEVGGSALQITASEKPLYIIPVPR